MLSLIWIVSVYVHALLWWTPTNLVLDAIRTRRGLRWGVPAMLLSAPFFGIMYLCIHQLQSGGPGWLNFVVLWAFWDAGKFVVMGPISLIMLARARIREAIARHRTRTVTVAEEPVPAPR